MKVWSTHQIECLQRMGITQWRSKSNENTAQSIDPLPTPSLQNLPIQAGDTTETLDSVKKPKQGVDENTAFLTENLSWADVDYAIKNCASCNRHQSRTLAVSGDGNTSAKLFIIGDAPNATENQTGQAFNGEAGELFNKMLSAINIKRESVYLTHFVKCFQPDTGVSKDEYGECFNHLQKQIDKVAPSLLLIFSEQAAQYILKNQSPLSLLRQQVHLSVNQIKTIVTYSPQLLLSDSSKKRDVWEDLKFTQKTLAEHNIEL